MQCEPLVLSGRSRFAYGRSASRCGSRHRGLRQPRYYQVAYYSGGAASPLIPQFAWFNNGFVVFASADSLCGCLRRSLVHTLRLLCRCGAFIVCTLLGSKQAQTNGVNGCSVFKLELCGFSIVPISAQCQPEFETSRWLN